MMHVEKTLERNRQIDRVRTLTMGAAEDREAAATEQSGLSKPIRRETFEQSYLTDLVRVTGLGIAYVGTTASRSPTSPTTWRASSGSSPASARTTTRSPTCATRS